MTRASTPRQVISRFVRTTRLRRRLWFGLASLASHGVVVGAALYLVAFVRPSLQSTAVAIGLCWLGVVLVFHLLNPGLSLGAADGALGLQDRLLTWWNLRHRRQGPTSDGSAFDWLEQDLSRSLDDLPPAARTRLWRRPARRLLWLLPLLLVVWLIGPIGTRTFLPSAVGITESAERGPRGQPGQHPGQGKASGPEDQTRKQPAGRDPQGGQPERKQPTPPPSGTRPEDRGPEQPTPKPPPAPVVPLPAVEEFVIPDFVGPGSGRTEKARVAVVEEGAGGRSAAADPKRTGGGPASVDPAPEYRRAEEQALRSRHVPPQERGFVARYFAELLRPEGDGRKPPR